MLKAPRRVVVESPSEAPSSEPPTPSMQLPPLESGSPVAQALAALWSGRRAVVLDSPPGAGKTYSACVIAAHLAVRANALTAVVCQTNAQAADFGRRMTQLAPQANAQLWRASNRRRPEGVPSTSKADKLNSSLILATASKLVWQQANFVADVLIVDEAYQLTWANMLVLLNIAPQVLLVGDPGQIAPVVTGDMSRWQTDPEAPHLPAPTVLAKVEPDLLRLRLPNSRRLGPQTVEVVQPAFYKALPFGSARPEQTLYLGGEALPELAQIEVTGPGGEADPAVADAIAERVVALLGAELRTSEGARRLAEHEVGVVTAHVSQAAALQARLASHPEIMVDTAERWQGLERPAMVVWDALAGGSVSDFDADTGRACVMLSRHSAHCSLVTRTGVHGLLARLSERHPQLRPHVAVRDAITALAA